MNALPIGGLFSFENFSKASQSLIVAKAKTFSQYHLFSETWDKIKTVPSRTILQRMWNAKHKIMLNHTRRQLLCFASPMRIVSSSFFFFFKKEIRDEGRKAMKEKWASVTNLEFCFHFHCSSMISQNNTSSNCITDTRVNKNGLLCWDF